MTKYQTLRYDYMELLNDYKFSEMQNDMFRELIENIMYSYDSGEEITKDYIETEYYNIIRRV